MCFMEVRYANDMSIQYLCYALFMQGNSVTFSIYVYAHHLAIYILWKCIKHEVTKAPR